MDDQELLDRIREMLEDTEGDALRRLKAYVKADLEAHRLLKERVRPWTEGDDATL